MLCVLRHGICGAPVLWGFRLEENRKCRIPRRDAINAENLMGVSVSMFLMLYMGLVYPNMHLWLGFKHVEAQTQRHPGKQSRTGSRALPVLHVTRILTLQHQRLLIDDFKESASQ